MSSHARIILSIVKMLHRPFSVVRLVHFYDESIDNRTSKKSCKTYKRPKTKQDDLIGQIWFHPPKKFWQQSVYWVCLQLFSVLLCWYFSNKIWENTLHFRRNLWIISFFEAVRKFLRETLEIKNKNLTFVMHSITSNSDFKISIAHLSVDF